MFKELNAHGEEAFDLTSEHYLILYRGETDPSMTTVFSGYQMDEVMRAEGDVEPMTLAEIEAVAVPLLRQAWDGGHHKPVFYTNTITNDDGQMFRLRSFLTLKGLDALEAGQVPVEESSDDSKEG